jgi:high-affinity Fe2+/Pb2+ permease
MKKYVLIGLVAGTVISLAIYYLRRKKIEGMEFQDFVDSSAIADDLFGNAFRELPDKL